jgi:hypothetical protein
VVVEVVGLTAVVTADMGRIDGGVEVTWPKRAPTPSAGGELDTGGLAIGGDSDMSVCDDATGGAGTAGAATGPSDSGASILYGSQDNSKRDENDNAGVGQAAASSADLDCEGDGF